MCKRFWGFQWVWISKDRHPPGIENISDGGFRMIVLSEEKLSLLFSEISQGFATTPAEIALFIVLVIGIIAFFILVSRYQAKKRAIATALQAQELFSRLSKKKALNGLEIELLNKMARYLKSPERKHLLFDSQATFNGCVDKLRKEETVSSSLVAGLRLKLGFEEGNPERPVRSSAELAEDQPVLIFEKKSKNRIPGIVLKNDPRALHIAVENHGFGTGLTVQIYFQNQSGLFTFTSRIRRIDRGMLQIAHSENIRRIQRRKVYRRKTSLPVFVRREGESAHSIRTTCTDLGGGGASLINPDRRLKAGDRLELYFLIQALRQPPGARPHIRVTGEVVRLSGGGRTAHIVFDPLPEGVRDRIIKYLFAKKKSNA